jgi:hypothetical protein
VQQKVCVYFIQRFGKETRILNYTPFFKKAHHCHRQLHCSSTRCEKATASDRRSQGVSRYVSLMLMSGVSAFLIACASLSPPPELAIVNGEDLERYRTASKNIFHLARSFVWGEKVERLGLDELFMGKQEISVMAHLVLSY